MPSLVVGVRVVSGGGHELIRVGYEPSHIWIAVSYQIHPFGTVWPFLRPVSSLNPGSVQMKLLCAIVPSPEHQLLYSAAIAL